MIKISLSSITCSRLLAEVGLDVGPDVVVPLAQLDPAVAVARHVHHSLVAVRVVRLRGENDSCLMDF